MSARALLVCGGLFGFAAACGSTSPAGAASGSAVTGGSSGTPDTSLSGSSSGSVTRTSGNASGSESGASGAIDASFDDSSATVGVEPPPDASMRAPSVDASGAPLEASVHPPVDSGTPSNVASDLALLSKVALFQVAAGPGSANASWVNKWTEAVFYMGVMGAYTATQDEALLTAATNWGTKNQWTLLGGNTKPPTRSADNQSAGQVYVEIYMLNPVSANATEIQNSETSILAMISAPNAGHVDWWWCDSLFMAPPLFTRLGAITGQKNYDSLLDTMWPDATKALYDPARKLFWRDSTFVNTDTYWSRGNGWVMGGIVRVLEYLPTTDPLYGTLVTLLQTLAASAAPLQNSTDGLWRSDLLHPSTFPNPETSGTALFTYAMAWGIHHSILDRATYLPVVQKGWSGLLANISSAGKLGYVQGTGSAPAAATMDDSYDYGVGAFLLAGSEVVTLE